MYHLTAARLSWVLAMLLIGTMCPADEPRPLKIEDKTLVTWVHLADLVQRGGGALTIIDPAERFDAIVFGERHAGRWMAGIVRRHHVGTGPADRPSVSALLAAVQNDTSDVGRRRTES